MYGSKRFSREIVDQQYYQPLSIVFFADQCKRKWCFEVWMLTHRRQEKTRQDKAKQDKIRQLKTRQHNTREDKTSNVDVAVMQITKSSKKDTIKLI
jgi:hypothetical protein